MDGAALIKLMAATFLPLCDELEATGALDRSKLADAMGLYATEEFGTSAAMITALQTVLRRPRLDPVPTVRPALRVIPGGREHS